MEQDNRWISNQRQSKPQLKIQIPHSKVQQMVNVGKNKVVPFENSGENNIVDIFVINEEGGSTPGK